MSASNTCPFNTSSNRRLPRRITLIDALEQNYLDERLVDGTSAHLVQTCAPLDTSTSRQASICDILDQGLATIDNFDIEDFAESAPVDHCIGQ
eukprot:scaffold6679_cov144-Amphora_coffeaeformis.AAC.11